MGFYLLVEIAIVAYTPVMCKLQSLKVGTIIGGIGFILGLLLTLTVLPLKFWAAILLVPYILWSPVGTYVTWVMSQINEQTTIE
jgi:tryptophan-rich sensory protein